MIEPFVSDPDVTLYVGQAFEVLRELPTASVHAILTSPPFYGLRDYGVEGQIGLEESPDEWAASLVAVFAEARRVLRDDGTLWIECGDSYAANRSYQVPDSKHKRHDFGGSNAMRVPNGLKQKDLIGAPFLLAFALRAAGWYWRGRYVWEKPDAMPESATDRCTVADSTILHFSKKPRYFHDRDAIREPFSESDGGRQRAARRGDDRYLDSEFKGYERDRRSARLSGVGGVAREESAQLDLDGNHATPDECGPDGRRVLHVAGTHNSEQHRDGHRWPNPEGRNARSVWRITTEATSFGLCPVCRTYWDERAPAQHCGVDVVAHFATWPHELAGKIIAVATSEAGCCGECGAPWMRETETERPPTQTARQARITKAQGNGSPTGVGGTGSTTFGTRGPSIRTLGWRPSCDCDAAVVPAVVLDPFAGSGTTARQARAMGRHAILIELSPDYAEIAMHRTRQLGLLSEQAS